MEICGNGNGQILFGIICPFYFNFILSSIYFCPSKCYCVMIPKRKWNIYLLWKKMFLMNISLQCIDNTEQQYYSLRHRWIKFTLTESGVICIILIVSHIIPQKIMIHDRSALLHCSYCGEYQHLVDHLPNLCNSRMSHHLSKPCNIYWLH